MNNPLFSNYISFNTPGFTQIKENLKHLGNLACAIM